MEAERRRRRPAARASPNRPGRARDRLRRRHRGQMARDCGRRSIDGLETVLGGALRRARVESAGRPDRPAGHASHGLLRVRAATPRPRFGRRFGSARVGGERVAACADGARARSVSGRACRAGGTLAANGTVGDTGANARGDCAGAAAACVSSAETAPGTSAGRGCLRRRQRMPAMRRGCARLRPAPCAECASTSRAQARCYTERSAGRSPVRRRAASAWTAGVYVKACATDPGCAGDLARSQWRERAVSGVRDVLGRSDRRSPLSSRRGHDQHGDVRVLRDAV